MTPADAVNQITGLPSRWTWACHVQTLHYEYTSRKSTVCCKANISARNCEKWRQVAETKTKMITSQFYIYSCIMYTCSVLWYLSVRLAVTYPSFTEYCNMVESLYFTQKLPLTLVNGGVILRSKLKVKVTGNEIFKKKSFFVLFFIKSGSIYIKPTPKWFWAHSTRQIHFTSKKA